MARWTQWGDKGYRQTVAEYGTDSLLINQDAGSGHNRIMVADHEIDSLIIALIETRNKRRKGDASNDRS